MNYRLLTSATAAVLVAAFGTATADHNSKNGEGWANMPNDIHNTRIETKEAKDNEAFREFVQYGEGSRTDNRFDTDSSDPAQSGGKRDMARKQEQQNAATGSANQNRSEKQANSESQTRKRSENQTRQRRDARSMLRSERSSNTRGSRRGGGRGK
jgi:hypothetical protein